MRPLFLLGAHRSGTTLLQRLLNSLDDVIVWGEHEGVLSEVARAYFRGAESPWLFTNVRPSKTDPRENWQAWLGALDPAGWDDAFRGLVQALFPPLDPARTRWWGFKEIRYGRTSDDRTVEFLGRLFPQAIFVFIVRHPLNALASAYRAPEGPRRLADAARVCRRWRTRYQGFRDWHASGRLRSYWIVYEDLVQGEGEIRRLLEDIGHAFGPAQAEVLAAEGGRGSSFRQPGAPAERWRVLPPSWRALAGHAVGPLAVGLGYTMPPVGLGWRLVAPLLWRWVDSADA